jgi:hypothetical protein
MKKLNKILEKGKYFYKNLGAYAVQHPIYTGMKIGGALLAPVASITNFVYMTDFADRIDGSVTLTVGSLITINSFLLGYLGYIMGNILPGLPIGGVIKSITYKHQPKPIILLREFENGYSIEKTMPIDLEREQKNVEKMFNESTHFVYTKKLGKYIINEEEHHYTNDFNTAPMVDTVTYYANGPSRQMIDIKDTAQDAKKSCLDHLLQQNDLTKASKVYIKNHASIEWKVYENVT